MERRRERAFMLALRAHVGVSGPLSWGGVEDFLLRLPADVERPTFLGKQMIEKLATSYAMRCESRPPPDGWALLDCVTVSSTAMLNGRPRRRGDKATHGGAFMAQLRDHVRKCGPLLGSRSDDFLKQLLDDVYHPRPLKRHIQQNAASYGMRFEDRQPPDGWVVELTGDVVAPSRLAQSDERTILTALAQWILSRSERRMRSGEIDIFYSQHKNLPRKKACRG